MTVGKILPLALKSRRSSHRKVTPTSRSDARSAEQQRSRSLVADAAAVLVVLADRCILRFAQPATRLPKFPLSLVETGRYIAAHATMPLVAVPTEAGDNLRTIEG